MFSGYPYHSVRTNEEREREREKRAYADEYHLLSSVAILVTVTSSRTNLSWQHAISDLKLISTSMASTSRSCVSI